MKIFVAVDSFKGSMKSSEIAEIMKSEFELLGHSTYFTPISDGGEGLIDAIKHRFNIDGISVDTKGPYLEDVKAEYVIMDGTAYIEMNSAAGIMLVSKSQLNPLSTTTYGVGLIIKDAISRGVNKVVLGIGGSSTNDGGSGLLQAMGVEFMSKGKVIEEPMNGSLISLVDDIHYEKLSELIDNVSFELISDVKNPLLGIEGCAYVYSKQKGADEVQRVILEENMVKYSKIVEKILGKKTSHLEGAGAAGGVGFGCASFLHAKIFSGIEYFGSLIGIDTLIQEADVVIVGEGKFDEQSKFGKAPTGIAKIAKSYRKKVIGIFGQVEDGIIGDEMDQIYSIVPTVATLEESLENPQEALRKLIRVVTF
jgi:glycerate kinase